MVQERVARRSAPQGPEAKNKQRSKADATKPKKTKPKKRYAGKQTLPSRGGIATSPRILIPTSRGPQAGVGKQGVDAEVATSRSPILDQSGGPLDDATLGRFGGDAASLSSMHSVATNSDLAVGGLHNDLGVTGSGLGQSVGRGGGGSAEQARSEPAAAGPVGRELALAQSRDGQIEGEVLSDLSLRDLIWLRGELQREDDPRARSVLNGQITPALYQRVEGESQGGRDVMGDVGRDTNQILIDLDVIGVVAKTNELKKLDSARDRHERARAEIVKLETRIDRLEWARGRDLIHELADLDEKISSAEVTIERTGSDLKVLNEQANEALTAQFVGVVSSAPEILSSPISSGMDALGGLGLLGSGDAAPEAEHKQESAWSAIHNQIAETSAEQIDAQTALEHSQAEYDIVSDLAQEFHGDAYKKYRRYRQQHRKGKLVGEDYDNALAELDVSGGAEAQRYIDTRELSQDVDAGLSNARSQLEQWEANEPPPGERMLLRPGQTRGDFDPQYAQWLEGRDALRAEVAELEGDQATTSAAASEASKDFKSVDGSGYRSVKRIEDAIRKTETRLEREHGRVDKFYPQLEAAASAVDARLGGDLREELQEGFGELSVFDAEIRLLEQETIPKLEASASSLRAEIDSPDFGKLKRGQRKKKKKKLKAAQESITTKSEELTAKREHRDDLVERLMSDAQLLEEHQASPGVIKDVSRGRPEDFAWNPRTRASAVAILDQPNVTLYGAEVQHGRKDKKYVMYEGRKFKIITQKWFGLAADGKYGFKTAIARVDDLLGKMPKKLADKGFSPEQIKGLLGIIKAATPLLATEGSIDSINTYDSQLLTLAGRGEKSERVTAMLNAASKISDDLGLGARGGVERMLKQVPKIAVPAGNGIAGGRFNLPALHALLKEFDNDGVFDAVLLASLNDGVFSYLGEAIKKRASDPPVFTRTSEFAMKRTDGKKGPAPGEKLRETYEALEANLSPAVMAIAIHNRIGAPADMPKPWYYAKEAYDRFPGTDAASLSKQVAFLIKVRHQYKILRTNERVSYKSFGPKWRQKVKDFNAYFEWQGSDIRFDNGAAREVIPSWGDVPESPNLAKGRPKESYLEVYDRDHMYADLGLWVIPQSSFYVDTSTSSYEIRKGKPVPLMSSLTESDPTQVKLEAKTKITVLEADHLFSSVNVTDELSLSMRDRVKIHVDSGEHMSREGWVSASAIFRRGTPKKKKNNNNSKNKK